MPTTTTGPGGYSEQKDKRRCTTWPVDAKNKTEGENNVTSTSREKKGWEEWGGQGQK